MEPSALDRSLQLKTEAEDHLDYDRYQEAKACHRTASEILFEQLKNEHPLDQVELMVGQYVLHVKRAYQIDYTEQYRYNADMRALYDTQFLNVDCTLFEQDIIFNIQKKLHGFVTSSNLLFRSLARKVSSINTDTEEIDEDVLNSEYIPRSYKELTAQQTVELIASHYQSLPKYSEHYFRQVEVLKNENKELIEELQNLEESKEKENPIIPPKTIITDGYLHKIKKRCGYLTESSSDDDSS